MTDTSSKLPGHALFAYGYDQRGLLVENEWGTDWGYNGYAELSWGFVAAFGQEVASITPSLITQSDWQPLPGSASAMSVGADGSVWSLGVAHVTGGFGIYHWNPRTWAWAAMPGGADRLAVDPNGKPWIVNDAGNILHWDGTAWQQTPGVARDVAIDKYGNLWIVSGTTATTGCPPSGCGTNTIHVAGFGSGVAMPAVTCTPSPIVCDGSIYSWTGSAWKQLPGTANRLAVAGYNDVWAVSRSGIVSYYTKLTCGLLPTPTPSADIWLALPPPTAKAIAIASLSDGTRPEMWEISVDGSLRSWNWASHLWVVFNEYPAISLPTSRSPRVKAETHGLSTRTAPSTNCLPGKTHVCRRSADRMECQTELPPYLLGYCGSARAAFHAYQAGIDRGIGQS